MRIRVFVLRALSLSLFRQNLPARMTNADKGPLLPKQRLIYTAIKYTLLGLCTLLLPLFVCRAVSLCCTQFPFSFVLSRTTLATALVRPDATFAWDQRHLRRVSRSVRVLMNTITMRFMDIANITLHHFAVPFCVTICFQNCFARVGLTHFFFLSSLVN